MQNGFTKRITPSVEAELESASRARLAGNARQAFIHLERAHVLGQESTYWHVKVHVAMLGWAIRKRSAREISGQILRIAGAAATTAFGLIPQGNTGGANVSPFRKMPIAPELAELIENARSGT
jgi:hypothetical protein